jgi:hypothetical protein
MAYLAWPAACIRVRGCRYVHEARFGQLLVFWYVAACRSSYSSTVRGTLTFSRSQEIGILG